MQAAMLIAPHTFVVQDHPHPEPLGDEVLVRVTHAGVCGSDVHFMKRDASAKWCSRGLSSWATNSAG